jgi:hypothetical protein
MTTRYQQLIDKIGTSQVGAARFLGIAERTSRRYASGELPTPPMLLAVLQLMIDLSITPEQMSERMKAEEERRVQV